MKFTENEISLMSDALRHMDMEKHEHIASLDSLIKQYELSDLNMVDTLKRTKLLLIKSWEEERMNKEFLLALMDKFVKQGIREERLASKQRNFPKSDVFPGYYLFYLVENIVKKKRVIRALPILDKFELTQLHEKLESVKKDFNEVTAIIDFSNLNSESELLLVAHQLASEWRADEVQTT